MFRVWLFAMFLIFPLFGRAEQPIIVVVKEAPPFVTKDAAGVWTGPAIDLWRHAAQQLGRPFEFRPMSLSEMLTAVETGQADVAVGALSVTAEREKRFDFTHPYHTTGFGIATREITGTGVGPILAKLMSGPFLAAAGALIFILFIAGALVFFLERRKNSEQFGGTWLQGLGSGFWWSAVTMTTVGYGDKAPVTLGGRFVALIWMFVAIITISGFTASITSSLTIARLTAVKGSEDLVSARVGTVFGSSSEEYLRSERISPRGFDDLSQSLARLASGELDAVVYDLPLLAYQLSLHPEWKALAILPDVLTSQKYAFAVPSNSDLRERLNQIIPAYTGTQAWRDKVRDY